MSRLAALIGLFLATGILAQIRPLANANFEDGQLGEQPPGWMFGFGGGKTAYSTRTVEDSCAVGRQCALIESNDPAGPTRLAFLYQRVDARSYRGMKFRFRAAVKSAVSGSSNAADLLVRIHRVNGQSCFFDNMANRRITSGEWMYYEIDGEVCKDAADIELGMQLLGSGEAWMDDASLTVGDVGSSLVPKTTTTAP